MRIATFNANSIRSRLDLVLHWLAEKKPDILALQETKVEDSAFPSLAFKAAGYNVIFRGEKAYSGVAIVSRHEPHDILFGLDDDGPADESRVACAKIGPVVVVNTYVPQGREIDHPMFKYKLEWFSRLRLFFDRHFTRKTMLVWLGDMNVAPEAKDIHNAEQQTEHVCYHIDVRRAFAETVAWGFVDVFRKHHPEPGQYTFFDYRTPKAVDRNMGWRVDHILATQPLAELSTDSWIDLEPRRKPKASDHTFLAAEFNIV